jgi:hypothetical protein
MPFSFTILGPGAVLILIGAIMVVNLLKKCLVTPQFSLKIHIDTIFLC